MKAEQLDSGHWTFRLGPVEKWIVTSLAALFSLSAISVGGYTLNTLQQLVVGQAVTNNRLSELTVQMQLLPALSQQVGKLNTEVERNTSDIAEDRQRLNGIESITHSSSNSQVAHK